MIARWIFTEPQTGRGRLDVHFSYVNVRIKSYVEDGNDILVEQDIIKALSFQDGVAGTTAVLLDCHQSPLPASCLTKKKFKPGNISSRATHDIHWEESCVKVESASGMSGLETIGIRALNQCGINSEMPPSMYPSPDETTEARRCGRVFTSTKPPLFIKDAPVASVSAATSTPIPSSSKAAAFQHAFEHGEVFVEQTVPTSRSSTASISTSIKHGWAKYPGNDPSKMTEPCLRRLKDLYDIGKANKKLKYTAEKALDVLLCEIVCDEWDARIDVTVPKIKAFFSMSKKKMEDAIASRIIIVMMNDLQEAESMGLENVDLDEE